MSSDLRAIDFHTTANGTAGVVLWTEEPGATYVARWRQFAVDPDGTLIMGDLVEPNLRAPGDLDLLPGEFLHHFNPKLWGDADYSRLYLSVRRVHVAADRVTVLSDEWRIYEFLAGEPADSGLRPFDPDYAAMRVVLAGEGPWADCTDVPHPEFVASCYGSQGGLWDESGTRFYTMDDADGWQAVLRLDIDNRDASGAVRPLQEWSFGSPQLVSAGERSSTATFAEPGGGWPRPGAGLDEPDRITFSYLSREGQHTVGVVVVLNADLCVEQYEQLGLTDGTSAGRNDVWLDCLDNSFYTKHVVRPQGWQSSEALLDRVVSKRGHGLYRRYVSGSLAGTSELLIEKAFIAVTRY